MTTQDVRRLLDREIFKQSQYSSIVSRTAVLGLSGVSIQERKQSIRGGNTWFYVHYTQRNWAVADGPYRELGTAVDHANLIIRIKAKKLLDGAFISLSC